MNTSVLLPPAAPVPGPVTWEPGGWRRPVDAGSLSAFRIAFGLIGAASAIRIVANGWATSRYSGPAHRFSYPGFGWVPKPGTAGIFWLLGTIAVASLLLAAGVRRRESAVVFTVGFAWLELIDVTTYLNHYWLMTLCGALFVFVPADRALSLGGRAGTVALGAVWLMRAQFCVVYAFAGLAKLHSDWLVHALPLRLWLRSRSGLGPLDPVLSWQAAPYVLSIAGAAFDCAVVPLLIWRRSRPIAFCALVVFHFLTGRLFLIGVFPWLMIAGATLFFEPDWPRRLASRLGRSVPRNSATAPAPAPRTALLVAAWIWLAIQVALPLRQYLYTGKAQWTNQGYRLAWNVLAAERAGSVSFRLTDPATGRTWTDDARSLYTSEQYHLMSTEPGLIRQAALELANQEGRSVEVRSDAFLSLNGRPPQRLIDPHVDLAGALPRDWILRGPLLPAP